MIPERGWGSTSPACEPGATPRRPTHGVGKGPEATIQPSTCPAPQPGSPGPAVLMEAAATPSHDRPLLFLHCPCFIPASPPPLASFTGASGPLGCSAPTQGLPTVLPWLGRHHPRLDTVHVLVSSHVQRGSAPQHGSRSPHTPVVSLPEVTSPATPLAGSASPHFPKTRPEA